ncbi:hypothetical protein VPHK460_0098 [Vibrio phage K460]
MEKVLRTTKLEMDDDFNIIDPEVEARKAARKSEILDDIANLDIRINWLMEEVGEMRSEMNELETEYKSI